MPSSIVCCAISYLARVLTDAPTRTPQCMRISRCRRNSCLDSRPWPQVVLCPAEFHEYVRVCRDQVTNVIWNPCRRTTGSYPSNWTGLKTLQEAPI